MLQGVEGTQQIGINVLPIANSVMYRMEPTSAVYPVSYCHEAAWHFMMDNNFVAIDIKTVRSV